MISPFAEESFGSSPAESRRSVQALNGLIPRYQAGTHLKVLARIWYFAPGFRSRAPRFSIHSMFFLAFLLFSFFFYDLLFFCSLSLVHVVYNLISK